MSRLPLNRSIELGARYRYPAPAMPEQKFFDADVNWFWLTQGPESDSPLMKLDRGISAPRSVEKKSGSGATFKTIPYIVTTSAPHRHGDTDSPWFDGSNTTGSGVVWPYWGETKPGEESKLISSVGNQRLLQALALLSEQSAMAPYLVPPVIVTFSEGKTGPGKGYRRVAGVARVTFAELKRCWAANEDKWYWNIAFRLEYVEFGFDQKLIPMEWLNARRNKDVTLEQAFSLAPDPWRSLF